MLWDEYNVETNMNLHLFKYVFYLFFWGTVPICSATVRPTTVRSTSATEH